MARLIPVGIDLGTTFSAVATLDAAGRSVMLPNDEGDLLTPSVVLFAQSEVVVGKDARNAAMVDPALVAEWVKRDMGSPFYSRPIQGRYLPPEVIQACILRKLRGKIDAELGPDARCVITVPAYFDETRRKATADAGEMAGLRVLDIVNEPTAAALAFGESAGYLDARRAPSGVTTVLVYDLGGGTFDCTLLQLSAGRVVTLATDGDVQLGGHDWDLRLMNHAAAEFRRLHNLDPLTDPAAGNRLLQAAIEAKHALSARPRTHMRVDFQGRSLDLLITRELFAELTADLLERTAYTTRQLINDARWSWDGVDRVLLVGGATRMPMVSEMLRQLSGREPDRSVNPDEAVARGAAIYAGHLLAKAGDEAGSRFEVTNVNSHSLGIEGIEPSTMRKINVVLIPRNTPLPARKVERFTTKSDNQRSIVVQVLEGESSSPGDCTSIGRTVIRDLPPGLPQGWPIDVVFSYETNGRLRVEASVPGTGQTAQLELERAGGLSGGGIDRWKRVLAGEPGFADFDRAVCDLLNEAVGQTATSGADSVGPTPLGGPATLGVAPPVPAMAATADLRRPNAPNAPQTSGSAYSPAESTVSAHWGGAAQVAAEMAGSAALRSPTDASAIMLEGITTSAGLGPGAAGVGLAPPVVGPGGGGATSAAAAAATATPDPFAAATAAATAAPTETTVYETVPRREVPRWLVIVIGYLLSAIVGLSLGYLVLMWLRPESFPPPW